MALETIPLRAPVRVTRHPALEPLRVVARGARRGAVLWGAAFGFTVWSIVSQYKNEYPTAADRARVAKTMAGNVGWNGLFGPTHHLDTVAGYTTSHMIGVLGLIGAIWGLLAGTRLLRGEEDAGRWELLLAGRTTRRRATASAVGGLGVALLVLWGITAAVTVAVGRSADANFSVTASLFLAVAAVATAAHRGWIVQKPGYPELFPEHPTPRLVRWRTEQGTHRHPTR